jgi:hypothetical protein
MWKPGLTILDAGSTLEPIFLLVYKLIRRERSQKLRARTATGVDCSDVHDCADSVQLSNALKSREVSGPIAAQYRPIVGGNIPLA